MAQTGKPDLTPPWPASAREGRRPRRPNLPLRSRLLLLVIASVVPLVCLGVYHEYMDYQADRDSVYEGLETVARGTAIAVERELQVRISSLETLAISPALTETDLRRFDAQAATFLNRLPADTILGLVTADHQVRRLYGVRALPREPLPDHEPVAKGAQVFDTGKPIVTDVHARQLGATPGFSVDVPVFRDGHVVYDLFIHLSPSALADLIARQPLPPRTVLTVVDTAGVVVARVPNAGDFVGSPIVPALWASIRANPEGVVRVPGPSGVPGTAAYAHVTPFGWAVIVDAPEEVIFAPIQAAIIRIAEAGAGLLFIALFLAVFAARGIMRPIEQLRRLAAHDDQIDPSQPATTGLPETDMVARVLVTAAARRQAAARELAESEKRFRTLFERSPGGMILLDPDTMQVIDCNAIAAGYVGYAQEELRGCPIANFALDISPERLRKICRMVVGGQGSSYETRVTGRLGSRDVLMAVAPVQLSGRTLVLINQIDVTDLRRAEAGLRVNEERLELAREGAKLGIWDWDVPSGTLTWSEHQWRLHGIEPRPGGPSPEIWRQAVHPGDLRGARDELVTALKVPGHPYATEYSVILPDGSRRRLLGRGQTIRGRDGRVVRMVGINMDVTARYEAEMARDRLIWMLETERSRLTEIIEALPVGVGIVDRDGRLILGNAAINRLNGPVIQSMTTAPRGEWIAHDADGNRLMSDDFPIRRALRLGETTRPGVDFLFRDTDGSEIWIRVGSIPLRREDGQVQEALGIFQDIDAEKRLLDMQQQINARLEHRVQEEMTAREAAQRQAAHAERMHALGQIAGGVAHDFNNVLQAVTGGAALIERRPDDAERVLRNARLVLDAARRGATITDRLLTFARRGDLRAEGVDIAALLTNMAEVLTHTLGGSVVCAVDVLPDLPQLFADRGQLETVLVNLATNARDAMPSGGIVTLSADTEMVSAGLPHPAGLEPGGYVRIIVKDIGAGIDQAVLAQVTEPFFTTKEPGKGTGLGLAMAKGFVEQSGGSLSIDSTVGQGTSITLWLPIAPSDGGVPGEAPIPARAG
jgi:PAS domain S-box-containing protein